MPVRGTLVSFWLNTAITAAVNGGILNPKIYSARPGDQCQAQQAVCSIDQSVFSILVWLPPPCGIVGLPF